MDNRDKREVQELDNKLRYSTVEPISLPLGFLKSITRDFHDEEELGRGGYGVVYKGRLQCGLFVAVKKIHNIHLVEDDMKLFQREVTSLMGIKHQNVVQLLGYCAETRWKMIELSKGNIVAAQIPERIFCFEYLCNRLDNHLSEESSGLEWNMRYKIIMGICSGLDFLHAYNIIHLDLKPQNILMDSTMMPKITDFGLSRLLGEQKNQTVTKNPAGSLGYMSPEYSSHGIITKKADIFSLGVIIIEILTGHRDYPLYPQSTGSRHFIEKVLSNWTNRFESASKYLALELHTQQVKQCINIALECVDPDKNKRPNAIDIIKNLINAAEQSCYVQNGEDIPVNHQMEPHDMQCEERLVALNRSVMKFEENHKKVDIVDLLHEDDGDEATYTKWNEIPKQKTDDVGVKSRGKMQSGKKKLSKCQASDGLHNGGKEAKFLSVIEVYNRRDGTTVDNWEEIPKEKTDDVKVKPKMQSSKKKTSKYRASDRSREGDKGAKFSCDIEGCDMSFSTQHDLSLHKRDICLVKGCKKKFFCHKYLLQHRKVHVDERPLMCSFAGCKKIFKWPWARTEHMRVHTGVRPYACTEPGCTETFRFVSDFSRHKRKTGHSCK